MWSASISYAMLRREGISEGGVWLWLWVIFANYFNKTPTKSQQSFKVRFKCNNPGAWGSGRHDDNSSAVACAVRWRLVSGVW